MKKICIMVQDKYRNDAVAKLRKLGVMHIEKTDAVSEKLSKALERKARGEDAIGLVQPYKLPKKKKTLALDGGRERRVDQGERRGRRATDKGGQQELEPYSLSAINAAQRPDLINLMNGMGSDRKLLEERITALAWERSRIAVWGEIDPEKLK
jgi:V/A-type H+-transporting ATPase subunit I